MLGGLESALKARRKFVDEISAVSEATGMRSEEGDVLITSSNKFALLQGGVVKSPTGFTGLVNQGATCYLNSLLQALFMLPEFRLALFRWEYDESLHGSADRCLSRQLQKLFAQLQMSERPAITTGALTKSFGWSSQDAFVQQDVHECMGAIFDFLSQQSIPHHLVEHQGSVLDVLKCSHCGVRRERRDTFRELHLEVRGMTSLTEMLNVYNAGEHIDGVECSNCEGRFTHQKAAELDLLPNILTLQLKRFDLDYNTFQRVKLNDRIKIPETLNMNPYLKKKSSSIDVPIVNPSEEQEDDEEDNIYEIMSILVHVGSAQAGHYFAFIHDKSSNKWLKFNDSTVEEIEISQLESVLGAGRDGREVEAPPNSMNPYMIIYQKRKKLISNQKLCNESVIDNHLEIPKDLRNEIDEENIKFRAMKLEWEEEKKWIYVSIYHNGPAKSIKIHEEKTIYDLCCAVIDKYDDLNDELLLKNMFRLRVFDPIKNVLLMPFDDRTQLIKTLRDPINHKIKPLKIELRSDENEPFSEFIANAIAIKILTVKTCDEIENEKDMKNNGLVFNDAIELFVPISSNIGQFRQIIANKLKSEFNEVGLVWFHGNTATELVENEIPLQELNVTHGDTFHVEKRRNQIFLEEEGGGGGGEEEPLKLISYFDSLSNTVCISYNDPSMEHETPKHHLQQTSSVVSLVNEMNDITNKGMKCLKIDLRKSLYDLKHAISLELNIHMNEFKVRRTMGGIELKDLNMSLLEYGLLEGSNINIKLGKPLKNGEYQFLMKYLPKLDEPVIALGPLVIKDDIPISQLKQELYSSFGQTFNLPIPSRFRLRLATGTGIPGSVTLKGVLPEDSNIAQVYGEGICDGKTIAIQKINNSEQEEFTSGHMLLKIRLWKPTSSNLYPVDEIGVMRNGTVDDLKLRLASIFNQMMIDEEDKEVKEEDDSGQMKDETSVLKAKEDKTQQICTFNDISLVKPFSYLLKDLENMKKLKWNVPLKGTALLTEAPLRLKDGDLIVFKYKHDQEQKLTIEDDQTSQGTKSDRSAEVGFSIYTPAQQLQREEMQERENQARITEENERLLEIRNRMEARMEAACNDTMQQD